MLLVIRQKVPGEETQALDRIRLTAAMPSRRHIRVAVRQMKHSLRFLLEDFVLEVNGTGL